MAVGSLITRPGSRRHPCSKSRPRRAAADTRCWHEWLLDVNTRGSLDLVLCDSGDIVAYADRFGPETLHLAELLPPYAGLALGDPDVGIDLTRRGSKPRKGCVVSSTPLAGEGDSATLECRCLSLGELILLRQGAVASRAKAEATPTEASPRSIELPPTRELRRPVPRKGSAPFSIVHRTSY